MNWVNPECTKTQKNRYPDSGWSTSEKQPLYLGASSRLTLGGPLQPGILPGARALHGLWERVPVFPTGYTGPVLENGLKGERS